MASFKYIDAASLVCMQGSARHFMNTHLPIKEGRPRYRWRNSRGEEGRGEATSSYSDFSTHNGTAASPFAVLV